MQEIQNLFVNLRKMFKEKEDYSKLTIFVLQNFKAKGNERVSPQITEAICGMSLSQITQVGTLLSAV